MGYLRFHTLSVGINGYVILIKIGVIISMMYYRHVPLTSGSLTAQREGTERMPASGEISEVLMIQLICTNRSVDGRIGVSCLVLDGR